VDFSITNYDLWRRYIGYTAKGTNLSGKIDASLRCENGYPYFTMRPACFFKK
jgi:hypothetical protein